MARSNFKLPAIYPITDTRISGISHAEQVRRLIAGGARLIQLRDKHASSSDFYAAALKSVRIARKHGVRIVINDRVDIAMTTGADGVHLGQDDLPADAARRLLGDDAIIGISTHSLQQALDAVSAAIDYIGVGPIFPTQTKDRPDPVVGVELVKNIRAKIGSLPIVAIGGIDEANIRQVLKAGADSAAVISSLVADASLIGVKMQQMHSIAARTINRR